jgi:hypothetical protein
MKIRSLLLVVVTLIVAPHANGQEYGFGAGIILGEPTGISLKYWTKPTNAWDAGVAWGFGREGAFHLHADYLWHKYNLIRVDKGRLPLYYGGGARILFADRSHFGIRGVVGLDYQFSGVPLDAFLEIAPVFDLVPATELNFNGGIGIRYFF